jgi:hypothetical protein
VRQAVNSRRVFWLAASLLLYGAAARGQLFDPPAPPRRAPAPVDAWLPTGAELPARLARPVSIEPAGCSSATPVCVQRGAGVPAASARAALQALERAHGRLVGALGLPPPLGELHLYLSSGGEPSLRVERGEPDTTRFDRAPAFCLLAGAGGAELEREATLCLGEAIAWRLDASATPHVRRAYAMHLWLITGRPTSRDAQAFDDLQAHPELAVVTRERSRFSEGAAIFFEYLDHAQGASHAGVLATALLAASAEKSAPGLWQWENEPDVFDVLRRTTGSERALAELVGEFALTRAFAGDRSDGDRVPSLDWLGSFGRVRFDWVIPFSSLPRRVAPLRPIEPTGSIYLWLALDQVPAGAELGFQAKWEPPVVFRWSLVRVTSDGRELWRMNLPYQERATEVEQRLVQLDGAAGILIVGTNLGGIDLQHPFDPDHAPFEPHAATVYLARL